MTNTRVSHRTVAALLLAGLAACSGDDGGQRDRPAAVVEVAEAVERIVASSIDLTGYVRAAKQSVIAAEVDGRAVSFPKQEGDAITKGETVVSLDDAEYAILLREAEGRLKRAEADADRAGLATERLRRLHERKIVSDEDLQNAQLALRGAEADLTLRKAELQRASLNVARCAVKAPFTGYLASRAGDVGEWIKAGDPLFTAVDIDPIQVHVETPERYIRFIATGKEATVTVDGLPAGRFTGTVTAVAPLADATTRTFLVKVVIPNRDGAIKAGMVGRVSLTLTEPVAQLLIPRDAIIWQGPQAVVFTIDADGKAESVPVRLGGQFGEKVAVETDAVAALFPGARLVVTGNEALRDGAPVKVVGRDDKPAAP